MVEVTHFYGTLFDGTPQRDNIVYFESVLFCVPSYPCLEPGPSKYECEFRTVTVPHCPRKKSLFPGSVVDPHHLDADPDSTYHPDADPDYDFYLMRIRIRIFIWCGCGSESDFSP